MITILLNGESRKIENEMSLDKLLDLFSLPSQRVAIEVNRSVVRRTEWESINVKDADTIEVIHFVGGG
jgi:sulfur carrier protein